jgi:hypothetical protein
MSEAISYKGQALMFASSELKNNKSLALAAVSQSGSALEHCSESLKKD